MDKDKIKLALESMGDIIKEAMETGEVKAAPEIINKRCKTCELCEEFIDHIRKCRACGCYMDLKTVLKATKCPLNKW